MLWQLLNLKGILVVHRDEVGSRGTAYRRILLMLILGFWQS